MAMKHIVGGAAVAVLLAGCAASGGTSTSGKITGNITVLTNRTDVVNTTLKDYATQFQKIYPGTKVTFQAIANYEGDVGIRLNSKDYGDVLNIPFSVTPPQLPQFFEPLGTVSDLSKKYRFVSQGAFDGQAYGIATFGIAQGIVYNKKVWAKAGLTTPPTTPTEFLNDLKAIKAKTSAIPYYTNYKNQWPLSKWQGEIGLNGSANANNDLAASNAPWTPGQPQYILDSLLFNIVQDKLSEPDPLTTDFAVSKILIGTGKVATMLLGSWAVPQMQQAAVDAGGKASDIGFLPFPYQVNGKFYSVISSDYLLGINKYSKNMATAKAWVTWFSDKSGYAASTGSISPLLGGANPSTLADFTTDGVQYVELNPAPKGQEALLSNIANASHIDLNGYVYRQKLVDIARGAVGGTMQSYFDQLNKQWAAAKKTVK